MSKYDTFVYDLDKYELNLEEISAIYEWANNGGNLIVNLKKIYHTFYSPVKFLEKFGIIYSDSHNIDGYCTLTHLNLHTDMNEIHIYRALHVNINANSYYNWKGGYITYSSKNYYYILFAETNNNIILFGDFDGDYEFLMLTEDVIEYIDDQKMY